MRKKLLSVLILFLFTFTCFVVTENKKSLCMAVYQNNDVETVSKPPVVNATASIVMDMKSGRVLYEKNAYTRKAMASTTKIMTAILALEKGNLEDDVTVSKRAAMIGGSRVNLVQGEVFKLKDLLYGLMLNSGNDAAIAIAEHIGGTVEDFVDLMNRKAQDLELADTSFRSPHGLDADGHYTTAYDLARLSAYALKNPLFSKIVSTKSITLPRLGLYNTNDMLWYYPGADGVKTGFTGKAGRCLVTSVTRNDWRIISVVLGCPTNSIRAQSSSSILDYAFDNYKPYSLLNSDELFTKIPVKKGIREDVSIKPVENIDIPLTNQEVEEVQKIVTLPDIIRAPVSGNIEVGTVKYVLNDKVIAQSPLKTVESIRRKNFGDYFGDILKSWGSLAN